MATCCCNRHNRRNQSAFSRDVETTPFYATFRRRVAWSHPFLLVLFSRRNAVLKQTTRERASRVADTPLSTIQLAVNATSHSSRVLLHLAETKLQGAAGSSPLGVLLHPPWPWLVSSLGPTILFPTRSSSLITRWPPVWAIGLCFQSDQRHGVPIGRQRMALADGVGIRWAGEPVRAAVRTILFLPHGEAHAR